MAWCVELRHGGRGAAGLGTVRLGGHGAARHGSAGYGEAVVVGLGVVRQLEAWRDGLVEVCCVRVTNGLSGRSWLGTPRRGKLGQGMAVLVNTKRAMLLGKECGGRGNSPLCGQGGLGEPWYGGERLGMAVAVRLVAARSG